MTSKAVDVHAYVHVGLVVLGGLLLGCQGGQAPAGFAPYDDWAGVRAISPDGVVYRVREADNEPEADLAFWREALKKRMLDAGYAFVAEQSVTASGQEGYVLELAAPLGMTDYAYLVGLFVSGSDLVIVESSGEVTRFAKRRDAVLEAILALKP